MLKNEDLNKIKVTHDIKNNLFEIATFQSRNRPMFSIERLALKASKQANPALWLNTIQKNKRKPAWLRHLAYGLMLRIGYNDAYRAYPFLPRP